MIGASFGLFFGKVPKKQIEAVLPTHLRNKVATRSKSYLKKLIIALKTKANVFLACSINLFKNVMLGSS